MKDFVLMRFSKMRFIQLNSSNWGRHLFQVSQALLLIKFSDTIKKTLKQVVSVVDCTIMCST